MYRLKSFSDRLTGCCSTRGGIGDFGYCNFWKQLFFRVPQVVCYYTPVGKFIAFLRRHILKVKYISLVNLVADKEVVRELVADTMTVDNVRSELEALLYNKVYRNKMLEEYDRIIQILGPAGASEAAARKMVALLKK